MCACRGPGAACRSGCVRLGGCGGGRGAGKGAGGAREAAGRRAGLGRAARGSGKRRATPCVPLPPWSTCPRTARARQRRAGSPAGAPPRPAGWWCRCGRRRGRCAPPSPTCLSPWPCSASSSTPSCRGWVSSRLWAGGRARARCPGRRLRYFLAETSSRAGALEGARTDRAAGAGDGAACLFPEVA